MRPSERRLLLAAGSVLLLMAALLASQTLLKWQRQLETRRHDLELARLETDSILAEAPAWLEKSRWITRRQPTAAAGDLEANAELDHVVKSARELGLDIQSQQLQEPQHSDHYRQFGLTLTVKGEMEAAVRWLHGLLSPDHFRVIPVLKITPDKDSPAEVLIQLQLCRWYAPDPAVAGQP